MSDQVHNLSMGIWVIFLAVAIAAAGTYVGIACARRAAYSATRPRVWMVLAALAIGGVAFWLPTIIALAGFSVDGSVIRFDRIGAVTSLLICDAASFAGLLLSRRRTSADGQASSDTRIVTNMVAAVVMGLGLTVGFYVAMRSIEVQGRTYMDGALIAVAAVIAVLGSLGVVWLSQADVRRVTLVGGSIAVALAPVLMHAAMMASLRVRIDDSAPIPPGAEIFVILFAAFVLSMLILVVPITALLMAPDRVTAELEAQARAWTQQEVERR
jgi:NO-binding membrane sensor protein with MHYT domain